MVGGGWSGLSLGWAAGSERDRRAGGQELESWELGGGAGGQEQAGEGGRNVAGGAHPRPSHTTPTNFWSPVDSLVLGPRVATALRAVPGMNGGIMWQLLVPAWHPGAAKQRLGYCRDAPRGVGGGEGDGA